MHRQRAFSLVELILVMLIITTVLGITAPSLRRFFARTETEHAALSILAMLRSSRTQAVAEGQTYLVHIDEDNGEIWSTTTWASVVSFDDKKKRLGDARQRNVLSSIAQREEPAMPSSIARPIVLPPNVTLSIRSPDATAGQLVLAFYPDGSCTPAVIDLRGKRDTWFRLRCHSPAEAFTLRQGEGAWY